MSLQLVIYPQSFDGQINSTSSTTTPNELIVGGVNFGSVNSVTASDVDLSGFPGQTPNTYFIQNGNALPTNPGEWYTGRDIQTTSLEAPISIATNLVMYLDPFPNQGSIIYQRLSGLTPGFSYTCTVTISADTSTARNLQLNSFNGNTYVQTGLAQNFTIFPTGSGTMSITFFAFTPNDIISFFYKSTPTTTGSGTTNPLTISSISVTNDGFIPTTTTTILDNGQVICDLYEDEDIPLTLSIDDFKNVAEKVQSYSKAFKLPGTKRNNIIFNNAFEITRADNGIVFNPYIKTKSVLKQDGFVLFEGYLRLIDIQEKEGEISYNVNLYSEVVALADLLKGQTFEDLGFEELAHEYSKDNIENSWNDGSVGFSPGIDYTNPSTSGFRSVYDPVKYPFVDWNHQMVVSDGTNGTAGNPELTKFEQAFRPFIQIKYLINRIFHQDDFPFTYTSEFFDTNADFQKLYMDFNWGSDPTGAAPLRDDAIYIRTDGVYTQWMAQGYAQIHMPELLSGTDVLWGPGAADQFTSDVANLQVTGTVFVELYNDNAITPRGADIIFRKRDAAGVTIEVLQHVSAQIGTHDVLQLSQSFETVLQNGEYLELAAKQNSGNPTEVRVSYGPRSYFNATYTNNASQVVPLLTQLRGELDQWEFLKGIFTMFNLVTIPDVSNPNNILIEPYADIFIQDSQGTTLADRGIAHDWTDKIDISEMKLTPLVDLNRITTFKFVEDDDDYIFSMYKNACSGGVSVFPGIASEGHLYGSLIFDASTSAQGLDTILTGSEDIVPKPFAATVIKPLMTQYPNFITPAIYSYNPEEGTSEGFDNSPRIMYDTGLITLSDVTSYYWMPAQNGGIGEEMTEFLQFSHLTSIPTVNSAPPVDSDTRDFHFGECQLIEPTYIGNATPNNLFNLYWLPYFAELYNPNTRAMTIKVNLSPGDINNLKLYDTVFIKNRQFRINKINYKPNDLATVEFILLP